MEYTKMTNTQHPAGIIKFFFGIGGGPLNIILMGAYRENPNFLTTYAPMELIENLEAHLAGPFRPDVTS